MFSFSGSELFFVAVAALLLFGPDKIPQIARTVGKFMREFNKYKSIMETTVRQELYFAEQQAPDTMPVGDRMDKAATASKELIEQENAASAAVMGGPGAEIPDKAAMEAEVRQELHKTVFIPPAVVAAPPAVDEEVQVPATPPQA
jgi:sec-independent protein translocase protein TatB